MRLRTVSLATLFLLVSAVALGGERVQAELRSSHFVTSDGVTLHYLEAGSGPILVFVPGWTMPAEVWEPQIRHFSATHRVVALDPRGHGRSEKASFGYTPSRRAQDIGELLQHLGGEPVVLAGWSLGVQEVLVYTQEHGTKAIRAVVLVDYDIIIDAPEQFTSRYISLQTEREEWTRAFIEIIFRNPPSDEYLDTMTKAALSVPTNAAAIMIGNLVLMGPNDLSAAVDALDRPALFVFSSLGWATEAAEEVRDIWPDAQVEVVDDTSHALFVDQPNAFNRLLEDFLASLTDGTSNK